MAYCMKCGVELDPSLSRCPLCKTQIPTGLQPKGKKASPFPKSETAPEQHHHYSPRRKLALASMLVTVIFLIPTLILLATVNYKQQDWDWVLPPLVMLTASWCYILILILFFNRKQWAALLYLVLTPVLLYLIDSTTSRTGWFLAYGVPIVIASYTLLFLNLLLMRFWIKNPFQRSGVILLSVSAFLILLELIISQNLWGTWKIRWSLLCVAALAPVSIFLFSLSILLKSSTDLNKIFRI
jgi:hypothetical protein